MSGTFEHIGEMTHLINHSRLKQRSLTITLIDLRNAFGEVNHNLIQSVLAYHHVPKEICNIVQNLYSNFQLTVITKEFTCNFIKVNKGVLQGDVVHDGLVLRMMPALPDCRRAAPQPSGWRYRAASLMF